MQSIKFKVVETCVYEMCKSELRLIEINERVRKKVRGQYKISILYRKEELGGAPFITI